jgi:hypothetical protein
MPVIGSIKTCTNESPVKDTTRPSNVTVNRAEWGDVVQRDLNSNRVCDPLVLECNGLQAGNDLLFINCDDPKVKQLVKSGQLSKLSADVVKPYSLPDSDLNGAQEVQLSDKAAMDLGLTKGCEFALIQRDKAGNVSAQPTFIELNNKGDTIPMWQLQGGTNIGDVAISMPQYQYRASNGYTYGSNNYNFNRGRDTTAATTYLDDIKLFLDGKTGKVTLDADHAVTGKTTVRLKNLTTQETFEAKDETGDGSLHLEGINLNPGDRYSMWTVDRNGVEEKVVDATFMPANCGCGSALNVQIANKCDG